MLGILGVALAMGAISGYANQEFKKAYPKMNHPQVKNDMDAEFARYGIKGKNGRFTETKINMIAARNNVQPNKYGVLPEEGWKHCRRYVVGYANSNQDIIDFEKAWYDAVEHQLKIQRKKISNKTTKKYCNAEKIVKKTMHQRKNGPTVVIELKHWHGIPKEEQLKRMRELQKQTIWGKILHEPPILRDNPRFEGCYTEVWIINGTNLDTPGSWGTNKYYKDLYTKCCGKIGYEANL